MALSTTNKKVRGATLDKVKKAVNSYAGKSHLKIKDDNDKRFSATFSPTRKVWVDIVAENIDGGVSLQFSPSHEGANNLLWFILIVVGLILGIVPGIVLIVFRWFTISNRDKIIQKSIDEIVNDLEF
jgi:hypothetical protein